MRRRALVALALVLLAPVGLVLALPWVAEPGARLGLRMAGLDRAATFERLDVGFGGAELTGLRVGAAGDPDLALDRLRLDYDAAGLRRARLGAVLLEGLVLRGRLDEAGLHLGALDRFGAAAEEPGAGGGSPALPPLLPERAEVRSGRLELATRYGDLALPFAAKARPTKGGRIAVTVEVAGGSLAARPGDTGIGGALGGDLRLAAEVDPGALPAIEAVTAEGVLTLSTEGLDVPGVAGGITGGGPIDLALAEGRLRLGLRGFELTALSVEPGLAALAEALPPPLVLTLGEAEAPLEIGLDLGGGADEVAAAGPLAVAGAANSRVAARLDAAVALGAADTPLQLAPSELSAVAGGVTWDGLAVPRAELAVRAAGTPGELRAELDLDVAAEGEPVPGLRLDGARLALPLAAEFDGRRLALRLREAGRLAAEAVRWGDEVRLDESLALVLDDTAEPLFEATLADGGVTAWRHRLTVRPTPVAASVAAGDGPLVLRGRTPRIDLELAQDGTGRALLAGGRLEAPAYELALGDIGAEIPLAGFGVGAGAPVPVTVGGIRHTGTPPWFRPLSLSAVLRPAGDRLGFRAELAGASGALAARIEGRHDLATGAGRARLNVEPLAFAPGGLQPAALVPPLAELVSDVSGVIEIGGTLAWGPGAPETDLLAVLNDLALTAGPARLAGVNGAVAFDSIAPPSTPPDQLLAVRLLDVGLPLLNGVVEFRLEEDGALVVDQARWQWAGGEVRTEGGFAYRPGDLSGAPLGVTLRASGLEISELLEQVQLTGLEGTGTLTGALPLRVEDGAVIVEGGELRAREPGWLRYRPEEPPPALQGGGESVALMLRALENFRYESLRITLDGRTDTEMDVGLHVAGANPDLYGGYPVEFNLNLEGELGAVLQAGIEGYTLPGRIAERMRRRRDR